MSSLQNFDSYAEAEADVANDQKSETVFDAGHTVNQVLNETSLLSQFEHLLRSKRSSVTSGPPICAPVR